MPIIGSLTDNAILIRMLMRASGEVESSACAGQRYIIDDSQNDLSSLTGNSAELLTGLVADIAFFRLWSRRPDIGIKLPVSCEQADEFLERLRLGERVFGILENHRAASVQANIETAAQVVARGGVVVQAQRFFGTRTNRLK